MNIANQERLPQWQGPQVLSIDLRHARRLQVRQQPILRGSTCSRLLLQAQTFTSENNGFTNELQALDKGNCDRSPEANRIPIDFVDIGATLTGFHQRSEATLTSLTKLLPLISLIIRLKKEEDQ